MDPYAVLGLSVGASEREVTAAYRRLAKRTHPDLAGGAEATGQMASVNVAYDMLRASFTHRRPNTPRHGGPPSSRPRTARPVPGAWLPEGVRRALGGELLRALMPREAVLIVTPAATWASPRTVLVATDRRLLWLLDDAPLNRVRMLRFRDVSEVGHRRRWPRKRRSTLRLRTTSGRRVAFNELHPVTAAALARRVIAGSFGQA